MVNFTGAAAVTYIAHAAAAEASASAAGRRVATEIARVFDGSIVSAAPLNQLMRKNGSLPEGRHRRWSSRLSPIPLGRLSQETFADFARFSSTA
ncbi:hypothetical protein [Gemmiger formicilis]|uniref:hypothetical protein n=1 Tax=Gemmiger formicilis TaxID=745368 RepID=UPI003CCAF41D